jgi:metal-responsive CopG/Arc/MetJ family transcriptional regulator
MARQLYKSILLNLKPELVNQIDEAVHLVYGSRTRFLREAVQRNLKFYEAQEKPAALRWRGLPFR